MKKRLTSLVSRWPPTATRSCSARTLKNMIKRRVPMTLLLLILFLLASVPVQAGTTIAVNTTTDELNNDGDCSLREAIQAANSNSAADACPAGSGADTISLPAGTYTLDLGSQLAITDDLTLTGAGSSSTIIQAAAASGLANFRVFDIASGDVSISGVTIRYGKASIYGGGLQNRSTLTLTNSVVSSNGAGSGGGIQNSGTLTLTNSTVSSNASVGQAAGIQTFPGTLTIVTNSTISNNMAGFGAGGISNGGTLTLTNSTVSGNNATQSGGGIVNFGTLILTNGTVAYNSAGRWAGGISNGAGGSTDLTNTIIGGNTAASSPDCGHPFGIPITSLGFNLISDGSGCDFTVVSGDQVGTTATPIDPLLSPLHDNGGLTQTNALLAGSPAIDAASGDCPPPATDQRGVARPQGAKCDIGAFELIAIQVAVNIKPGSDPNSINLKSKGVVPVAVLTTADFDATTVDPVTVVFAGASPLRWATEDVDGDSDLDLVFHFKTQELSLDGNSTEATLTGETFGGIPIQGTGSVNIVPKD